MTEYREEFVRELLAAKDAPIEASFDNVADLLVYLNSKPPRDNPDGTDRKYDEVLGTRSKAGEVANGYRDPEGCQGS